MRAIKALQGLRCHVASNNNSMALHSYERQENSKLLNSRSDQNNRRTIDGSPAIVGFLNGTVATNSSPYGAQTGATPNITSSNHNAFKPHVHGARTHSSIKHTIMYNEKGGEIIFLKNKKSRNKNIF